MAIRHPFEWLSISVQKRAFVVSFVLTLVVMASLNVLGGPLKTAAAPSGIISFEFAGGLSRAQGIVESWGPRGQIYAGLNLGLDYLYLVAYPIAIALGCVLVARSLTPRVAFLSSVGRLMAWVLFVAGLLDAVENYALIRVLLGSLQEAWPVIARWCAWPKFLIVAVGLVYVLTVAAVALGAKTFKRDRRS